MFVLGVAKKCVQTQLRASVLLNMKVRLSNSDGRKSSWAVMLCKGVWTRKAVFSSGFANVSVCKGGQGTCSVQVIQNFFSPLRAKGRGQIGSMKTPSVVTRGGDTFEMHEAIIRYVKKFFVRRLLSSSSVMYGVRCKRNWNR